MLKRLEKHNIITLVRQNSLLEFTKKSLEQVICNCSINYYTYNVENTLQELVNEGALIENVDLEQSKTEIEKIIKKLKR